MNAGHELIMSQSVDDSGDDHNNGDDETNTKLRGT